MAVARHRKLSNMRPEPMSALAEPGHLMDTSRLLLDCVADSILILSDDLEVHYANRAAHEFIFGSSTPSAGKRIDATSIIHSDDLEAAAIAISQTVDLGTAIVRLRVQLPSGDIPVEVSLTNHKSTPGIDGIVACFRNLEQEEALRDSLERQRQLDQHIMVALTDELTGLPTRRLFLDRLDTCLGDAAEAGKPISIFFIDLDGFKAINDAHGHNAGDGVLRATTKRLLDTHPKIENWGRIGGDEFVLFVERCGPEQAASLALRLSEALRQASVLGGRTFYPSASIGIATTNDSNVTAEIIVRRADIAMYAGKRVGRDSVSTFVPEMEESLVTRTQLERQLKNTLEGSGPDVAFQPIVDLFTGNVFAVEVLARWTSPTQGRINPEDFVQLAEQMGVIDQLDRHVLRKACRAVVDVIDPANGVPIDITVNFSPAHLATPGFTDTVLDILKSERFDATRLIVEVTESLAVEQHELLHDQLTSLHAAGIRVALDDFGTGQSSLAQLENLPVDLVKVDRSFLMDVPESSRRLRYVETIVAMANALELRVIFEGIETPEQARALTELGVSLGQGFLMARPTDQCHLHENIQAASMIVRSTVSDTAHWQSAIDWTGTS